MKVLVNDWGELVMILLQQSFRYTKILPLIDLIKSIDFLLKGFCKYPTIIKREIKIEIKRFKNIFSTFPFFPFKKAEIPEMDS